jgi:hypothetical protein
MHMCIYVYVQVLMKMNVFVVLVDVDTRKVNADNQTAILGALRQYRLEPTKRNIDHVMFITTSNISQIGYVGSMCLQSSISIVTVWSKSAYIHTYINKCNRQRRCVFVDKRKR